MTTQSLTGTSLCGATIPTDGRTILSANKEHMKTHIIIRSHTLIMNISKMKRIYPRTKFNLEFINNIICFDGRE